MINRPTKLRWRRRLRLSRIQVEDIGSQAEERLEQQFIRRLTRLPQVGRFVASWIFLLVLLGSLLVIQTKQLGHYYKKLEPVAGGSYSEGLIGSFTNANPMYATSLVDTTVSRLIFAGLLKYNQSNHIVGDLAQKWKSDPAGKIYTVTLKPNLTWQDGQPLTASDVVFTFHRIQNPDAGSPLFSSWRGINVQAIDQRTVVFKLPSALASFVYGLTVGIIPAHSLSDVDPADLRSAAFNTTNPVGAGPFSWQTVEVSGKSPEELEQHIGLVPFDGYQAGKPKLDQFVVKTYASEDKLIAGFKHKQVNAMVGLDKVPEQYTKDTRLHISNVPLTAETIAFFRTDSKFLENLGVRQALTRAVNVAEVQNSLGYPTVKADEPLLRSQLGYSPRFKQLSFNPKISNQLLDKNGWHRSPTDQLRYKHKVPLVISLYAQNTSDNERVAQDLQTAWQALGAKVEVILQTSDQLQQTIKSRNYDVLLNSISIGVDPDVFAYWHSSQANPLSANRLNFSNYRSKASDTALEAGRSRLSPAVRSAKYRAFLSTWRGDAPGVVFYQPRFLYISDESIYNFKPVSINSATDRFSNVDKWMIREGHEVIAD